MPKNEKEVTFLSLLLSLIMLIIFGLGVYKNIQSKQQFALPIPMGSESDSKGKTPPIGRAEDRKTEYENCINSVYENTREVCTSESGFDPKSPESEDRLEGGLITKEDSSAETDFWICYDKVSIEQTGICEVRFSDIVEITSNYYKCMSVGPNVRLYCGEQTNYTSESNFPEEYSDTFWECMEKTTKEKEGRCQSETEFTP